MAGHLPPPLLPRLHDSRVFQNAVQSGVETKDFFGYASGKSDDEYLGFAFGRATSPVDRRCGAADRVRYGERLRGAGACHHRNGKAVFQTREEAERYIKSHPPTPNASVTPRQRKDGGWELKYESVEMPSPSPPGARLFYGTVALNPVKAKLDFAQIVDEVVLQFTLKPNAKVTLSVEIQAEDSSGFDEATQRVVRENCTVLKFKSVDFEK